MSYSAIIQATKEEPGRFYKRKSYILLTLFSILNIGIDYFRRDNLGSFIDNEIYQPNFVYYSSYAVFYAIWLTLCLMIISHCKNFLKQSRAFIYQLRVSLSLTAFSLGALSGIMIEVSITLSIIFGDVYRSTINEFYHSLKPAIGLILLLSATPTPVLSRLLHPLKFIATLRQKSQASHLRYLHQRLLQVTPSVHLPLEQVADLDMRIEIGDARELVWSHTRHSGPITAKEEAKILFSLLQNGSIVHEAGVYQPPLMQYDELKHIVMVAKHLRRLELLSRLTSVLTQGRTDQDAIPQTFESRNDPSATRPPFPR